MLPSVIGPVGARRSRCSDIIARLPIGRRYPPSPPRDHELAHTKPAIETARPARSPLSSQADRCDRREDGGSLCHRMLPVRELHSLRHGNEPIRRASGGGQRPGRAAALRAAPRYATLLLRQSGGRSRTPRPVDANAAKQGRWCLIPRQRVAGDAMRSSTVGQPPRLPRQGHDVLDIPRSSQGWSFHHSLRDR
jgi:hypothetical protein